MTKTQTNLSVAARRCLLAAVVCGPLGLLCASTLAAAEVDPAVRKAEAERVAVVERASSYTVAVFAANGQGGGSGVVISPDGYALSNFHVTRECGNGMKCGMADGNLYDAVIVGIDPTGDVALIKLLGRDDFPHAELADSDNVRAGDWCFTIGNPFLLATDFKPTVCYGVISGVHRYQPPAATLLEYTDCLQADAAINPGNSGGPLFDTEGRLIGINGRGSFEKRGRVNVGVGYAISINQIKNFLGHLKSGRVVDHATLGARLATDSSQHVIVDDILTDSDAYRRGLRYGDEVLSFAGRPVSTVNGFKNILGIYPKGWRVPLSYRRNDQIYDILVRLAGVHGEAELASLLDPAKNKPHGREKPKPGAPKPGEPEVPKPEQPKGGKPPGGPAPDGPQPEDPHGADNPHGHPEQPMAEIAQQHFVARPGYVNYFFNQLNQDRIWKALASRGDVTALAGKWTISGDLASGGEFEFELTDKVALVKLPGGEAKADLTGPLSDALGPPGSGGLLVSLGMWHRLVALSPARFGAMYYLGSVPVPGHEGRADSLVGTHNGVQCRFMVDPADGALLEVEMFPDDDADPCEVYFSDYHEFDGRMLPRKIEVRYGDGIYQVFDCKQFKFEPLEEK
jgi:serine protease Do